VIQRQIDTNKGRARVAADLSSKGIEAIKAEEAAEKAMAEDLLTKYEVQLGLKSPETAPVADSAKNLGPMVDKTTN
jgi:SOS response regulatory protein OraA/RecX